MVEHEEEQDRQESLERAIAVRTDLQRLRKSEGWARLVEILQEQVETRRNVIELTPLASMDGVLEEQYKKGEIAALRLIIKLPETTIETLSATIEVLQQEQRDEDE